MKKPIMNIDRVSAPRLKMLFLAMASQTLVAGYCHAAPTGGVITGGDGNIDRNDAATTITQNSERLSINWSTFDVAADERVEFVQPGNHSIALNRILDSNGSSILGRIDANGHVILMNPNGIIFGEHATVNVGGLVASGLNIHSDDFMNGDFAFAAQEGSVGTVVNRGIINAAVGGNVALLGKTVANHGLISATLGHVALASGSEAVVTFDDQGLIGLRIDKEALASEIGDAAVQNNGLMEARGGKVLLNASVSADLFSQAVNRGEMSDNTNAVLHDDGSFTLGAGNAIVNNGGVDASGDLVMDAGYVILAGGTIDQQGDILALGDSDIDRGVIGSRAGQIYLEATDTIGLGASSHTNARISSPGFLPLGGKLSLQANEVIADEGATLVTSGNTILSVGSRMDAPSIETHNLFLQASGDVTQAGAARVRAHSHFLVANGANIDLTHAKNRIFSTSLDARDNSEVDINSAVNFLLNDIKVVDSELRMQTEKHVLQEPNTHIQLYGSEFRLTARGVDLGRGNADTTVNYSLFDIRFRDYVNTNNSITLVGDHPLMATRAHILGSNGSGIVQVTSSETIDLSARMVEGVLTIDNMLGTDARFALSDGRIRTEQKGPIELSGTLHWESWDMTLDHPENDIDTLQGRGVSGATLTYVDKNDVTLGDLSTPGEGSVSITSLGEGGTVRQAQDTLLEGGIIQLKADNVDLGAHGRSEIRALDVLQLDFSDSLHINGAYSLNSAVETLLEINGDTGSNNVIFGHHASTSPFASSEGVHNIDIDLGSGDDHIMFVDDFSVTGSLVDAGIRMGSGNDGLTFIGDLAVDGGRAKVDIDTGEDRDRLMFLGEFAVNSTSSKVDINMGCGNDRALFRRGLTVESIADEGSRVNMGRGNDRLIFINDVDVPIYLGAGRDFALAIGSDTAFDLSDYNPDIDKVVVIGQ